MLKSLKEDNIKIKPTKCQLFCKEANFLGYVISMEGIGPYPEKVEAVKTWPVMLNIIELWGPFESTLLLQEICGRFHYNCK